MSAQSNLESSDELWSRAPGVYGDVGTKDKVCLIWGSSYLAVLLSIELCSRTCSTTNELKEKSIVSAQSNLEPSDELCPRATGTYGDVGTKV